jgi:hypothetical protein
MLTMGLAGDPFIGKKIAQWFDGGKVVQQRWATKPRRALDRDC